MTRVAPVSADLRRAIVALHYVADDSTVAAYLSRERGLSVTREQVAAVRAGRVVSVPHKEPSKHDWARREPLTSDDAARALAAKLGSDALLAAILAMRGERGREAA